ncbi:amidohydrolase family protein [Pseudactinotalea suaedae]|uniref:amidohydrolase family protein n=1 Tax=Pseudactinotalea suaedae TaxID=1524924 RepID=UPI001391A095|nr:amidohydrolase family protein [Pseudactinotalea suaedae]
MSEDASGTASRGAVIDAHAHLLPAPLLASGGPSGLPLPGFPPVLSDVTARLRRMDEGGIDRQVVSPWIELAPNGLSPERAERHIRRVNDALAEVVGRHPDRLVGMAMVPQHTGEQAAGELLRAVTELGMCGALLTTSGIGLPLADPAMEPFWAAAERLSAVLMPHPRHPVEVARTRAQHIGDLVGTPVEGTLAVVSLLRAGVLDRHSDLRICVVHGGGALPILAGRVEALWDHSGAEGGARPLELLGRLYFDTLTHDDRALAFLADLVGADRLLLGTDFPFATGDPRAVERVERLASGRPDVRQAVLGQTLAGLLGQVRHDL